MEKQSIVIILGSAPDAVDAAAWELPGGAQLVAINNAWRVRDGWNYLIHPDDFSPDNRPRSVGSDQNIITSGSYVPAQNRYGGFVYAGGTMAFTAGYWALDALKPDVLAWFGCDMVYSGAKSHFYGQGDADPLRDDVTLQSLEAKSARLMALAARQGCICVNLSDQPESRLLFPRSSIDEIYGYDRSPMIDNGTVNAALKAEAELGYMVENGEYWKHTDLFDPEALTGIDRLWLEAVRAPRERSLGKPR